MSTMPHGDSVSELSAEFEGVFPSQFFESHRVERCAEPFKRLMFALLLDAVRCFRSERINPRLYSEAARWIFSTGKGEAVSFVSVCQALEVDPDCMRRGLLEWRARQSTARRIEPPLPRATLAQLRR
jgi:L-fucose isomerase-like protein